MGGVACALSLIGVVRSPHPIVNAGHSSHFSINDFGGTEGGDHDPSHGPGEATEGVGVVARMLGHTGHRPGVKRLHQQSADSSDQGGVGPVYCPHRASLTEIAGIGAFTHLRNPGRFAIGRAGETEQKVAAKPSEGFLSESTAEARVSHHTSVTRLS